MASEHAPEMALRPSYLSTFGMASDQAGKLGVGKNNKIISMYSNYQVQIFVKKNFYFHCNFIKFSGDSNIQTSPDYKYDCGKNCKHWSAYKSGK